MKPDLRQVAAVQSAAVHADLDEYVREALKRALSETLTRIIARENLDALMGQLLQQRAAPRAPCVQPEPPCCALLTAREREILNCITRGDSNKAIARTFDLSLHTVKRHVANILGKLGVSSRTQAAMLMHPRH